MTTITTSTSAFYERAKTNMSSLRAQAETLQTQLSTGSTISKGSDDPLGASRLRALRRADALAKIDTGNVSSANANLQLTDTALGSIATAIGRAKQLATWAASDTLTQEQRASMGEQINQVRNDVMVIMNSRDANGHALFGGGVDGNAYTLDGSGNAVYAGSAGAAKVPIGDGQSVTTGITGPAALGFSGGGGPTDLLALLKTLGDGLQPGAPDPTGTARAALDQLDTGLQAVTTQQTIVGARMSWLDVASDRATALSTQRSAEEATIGGVDISSTAVELQRALTVLEASQASFTKLSSISLFDVLS